MGRRQDRPTYRSYTKQTTYGSVKLVAWMQRRCKICGRFIGGVKQFLCKPCYEKRHARLTEINHLECRNQVQYYGIQTIYELIGISIPTYLRNNLRSYT